MAEALQFDKCCCCINLRIGALILGYLELIGGIIAIGFLGWLMAGVKTDDGHVVKMPAALGIMIIIVIAISLFFHALLLAGVYQRKPSFVRAAWIYMIVSTLLGTILQLCDPSSQTVGGIIGILIVSCLNIYLALCVRSYELALKEEGFSRPNQGGHA